MNKLLVILHVTMGSVNYTSLLLSFKWTCICFLQHFLHRGDRHSKEQFTGLYIQYRGKSITYVCVYNSYYT